MNKILVTGGAGFVGRHLVHKLLNTYKSSKIIVVDNIVPLTGGIDPNNGWPFFSPLDFKNFIYFKEDCRSYFKKNPLEEFDCVFHLAAMVGGRKIIEDRPLIVSEDLAIDSLFWSWAVEARPKKIITFSSSAAYPIQYQTKNNFLPLDEKMISFQSDLGMPDLSYGWAKLTSEYLGKLAYEKHGLNSVVYRPFSGYGPDQDENYPFPSLCKKILNAKNNDEILVWGSGQQMRDFIHIDDCINGILETMDKIDNGDALNLGTGIGTSFNDFIKIGSNKINKNLIIKNQINTPEGVFARISNVKKLNDYGYTAKIKLEDGLNEGISYFDK